MMHFTPRLLSPSIPVKERSKHFDVIVSGGGLVGAAMFASLQALRSRFMMESETLTPPDTSQGSPSVHTSRLSRLLLNDPVVRARYNSSHLMHQLRTVSLTPVASKLLDNLNCWRRMGTKHAYYRMAIRHEQVNSPTPSASSSNGILSRFLLGSENRTSANALLEFTDLNRPLGFVCYNTEVNAALLDVIEEQRSLLGDEYVTDELAFGSAMEDIVLPPPNVVDGVLGKAVLRGDSDVPLDFSLLLGCEGRGSRLRDLIGTASVQHDYAQMGFVCSVRLERVDDGNVCCFQNFFLDGSIIAMLPTSQDTANIIFSTTHAHARELAAATQEDLVNELNNRMYKFAPRDIPRVLEVPEGTVGGKHMRAHGMFPLKLNFALSPYSPRCLLLGDAAHGIHPFAGQGLNLGLYDVCVLTEILEHAIRSGQDIGNVCAVGHPFAAEMMLHTGTMITAMEGIHGLLGTVPELSCLGMKALQNLPLVSYLGKEAILHVASGALFAQRHSSNFLLL